MLSYRHGFHAGNHADVLKHMILVQLLDYLTEKDKPLWYVDTHAGAGGYRLDSGFSARQGESSSGIGRLWSQTTLPTAVERYRSLVRAVNPDGRLLHYPGSAELAQTLLRSDDKLWLYELHPQDHATLAASINDKAASVQRQNGFEGLRAHLPPASRRVLVLMDPPYEVKSDYATVIATLKDALSRFATGTYMVWYPMIESDNATRLPAKLLRLGASNWLHAQLIVSDAAVVRGMWGSGVFVINPPYTLPESLEASLPRLVELLGQDPAAGLRLEWHID